VAFFDDEELSRIVSAHAGGQLRAFGSYERNQCCMYSSAYPAISEIEDIGPEGWDWGLWQTKGNFSETARQWFDFNYNPGWPLGKFLRELEKQGLA